MSETVPVPSAPDLDAEPIDLDDADETGPVDLVEAPESAEDQPPADWGTAGAGED